MPAGNRQSFLIEDWEGKTGNNTFLCDLIYTDLDYIKTFKLNLLEGEFFSKEACPEITEGIVVNETLVKKAGMVSPVGKKIDDSRIMGVVKDFHINALHDRIKPLVIASVIEEYRNICIRIRTGNINATIDNLKGKWEKIAPGFPFEFSFLDEKIDQMYNTDRRIGKLINLFTFFAVFIAALGLIGLISYVVERKTKEIGIRKVLGANISNVISLISREFLILVFIANLIALPAAYLLVSKFLEYFVYRISLSWVYFITAGFLSLSIALLSILFQTVKAASANPVDSLRNE